MLCCKKNFNQIDRNNGTQYVEKPLIFFLDQVTDITSLGFQKTQMGIQGQSQGKQAM
jgi:hypothetical protein